MLSVLPGLAYLATFMTFRDVHRLELHPPKVVVRFGDPVSVNCSTSTKHYGMGWEAPVGGVNMRDDVNVITWTVPALTDWDKAPICFINTDDGQHNKTLSVIVYKTPDSVSISYVNHTGPVMEKTQYELQCDIKNIAPLQYLSVRWYKGQTLVDSQTFTDDSKTPVSVPVPLLITPSRADDGAQYRCEAELDLGAEGPQPPPVVKSETLNMTVHYASEIDCPLEYEVREQEEVNISCTAVGSPTPEISWSKDGKRVDRPKHLSRENGGSFTISATNKHGTKEHVLKINVLYAPEIDCPLEYEVREQEEVNISCTAVGSPTPEISWSKDGKRVDRPKHLSREDGGSFTISATNKHGTKEHVLKINVLYAPEIDCPLEYEVREQEEVNISCTAVGSPAPEISWSKDGKRVDRPKYLSREHGGSFTINATNKHGTKEHVLKINVLCESSSVHN
ncbi:intercellular adhesion molecule 5-like [Chanos chanos]|uniref:Intercellular adhesion molecule 5-like n=1 Tax=Chanos chanos TaxID=29144 RepID=A0A6J2WRC2_CHACN|nr:intercellular adhesion molecule 5-like [Chanos chanos]